MGKFEDDLRGTLKDARERKDQEANAKDLFRKNWRERRRTVQEVLGRAEEVLKESGRPRTSVLHKQDCELLSVIIPKGAVEDRYELVFCADYDSQQVECENKKNGKALTAQKETYRLDQLTEPTIKQHVEIFVSLIASK